jgi:hypothetical protein
MPVSAVGEIRVDAPSQAFVEALGPIDIGDWQYDNLDLLIESLNDAGWCAHGVTSVD